MLNLLVLTICQCNGSGINLCQTPSTLFSGSGVLVGEQGGRGPVRPADDIGGAPKYVLLSNEFLLTTTLIYGSEFLR